MSSNRKTEFYEVVSVEMKFEGIAFKVKDNVSSESILSPKYYGTSDETELGKHVFETNEDFLKKPHEILVTGKNFGGGAFDESVVKALKSAGVKIIVARSVGRMFFRGAINNGLPVLALKDSGKIETKVSIHLETGEMILPGEVIRFPPFQGQVKEILESGGLVQYIKQKRQQG